MLVVGSAEDLNQNSILVKDVNWISGETPHNEIKSDVKIRYKADFVRATVIPIENQKVRIEFDNPVRDATPGQFAVFYNDDELLGGGEIEMSI